MQTMHAIVHRKYGTPDVLRYEEIARPVPGDDDVLVRVHAAGASIGDHIIVTGKPYPIRFSPFGGWPRPRKALLALKEIVETKKLKPVIERRYALSAVADALQHVGERHSQGQTVIQIAS